MNMDEIITLSHGSGGKKSSELIESLFYKHLGNDLLLQRHDSTVLPPIHGRPVMTTDSFVIQPLFFPGGDIGKLAVCGTVNDIAMSGARPLYISLALIIEEGLPLAELEAIIISIARAAEEAGVYVVTGDTKVVNRGAADKLFINTTGVGVIEDGRTISGSNAHIGDKIIISGTIGDHGTTIMAERQNLGVTSDLKSDCAVLSNLIRDCLNVSGEIHVLRDPTRGGVAATLNEIAADSAVTITLDESSLPVKESVQALNEILGLDPLYCANEGKFLTFVSAEDADAVLETMRMNPLGVDAAVIGEVCESDDSQHRVIVNTHIGGRRIVHMPAGELLPRIC